jgi:hypothetical protein
VAGEIATGGAGSPAQLAAFLEAAALLADVGVPKIGGTFDEMRGQIGDNYVAIVSPFAAYDIKRPRPPSAAGSTSAATPTRRASASARPGPSGASGSSRLPGLRRTRSRTQHARTSSARRPSRGSSPASISAHVVGFEDSDSDPLAQRAAAGVKGFLGGALITAGGGPRYAVVGSLSTTLARRRELI